ncbi:MAG: hypothetical protein IPK84_02410 [Candidatus Moraniibacteriota bacterium]|nr:MAG: hypothetical protein IPK84_02410 [Candidatus Moranbacteria bacterium]
MKEKKQSANWNIAATHYLTSGLAMPFLVALVLGIPTFLLIGKDDALLVVIANSALWFLGIWLGVRYSAKYLAKTYIVNDSNKVIKLATIYAAVLGGLFRINKMDKGISLEMAVDFILFVGIVIAFYLFSKKYVHNTPAEEIQPTPVQ